jgi:release factor glutamine methyltransferase
MPPRIAQLIEEAAARLSPVGNPALDAEMLFRGISGLSRADLLAKGHEIPSPGDATRFEAAVQRRERHEPIQYILGVASFWRDDFLVNPFVLIPRPETEILVEAAAKGVSPLPEPRLLDLGTGSGCIALSLLRELPRARALAVDLSDEALKVASENARRLGLAARIDFQISRWFDAVSAAARFDAIVSNPPYVARSDEAGLPRDVRDFEPHLALFADPSDELSSFRMIVAGAAAHLQPLGLLAVEVGLGQAGRVATLFRGAGFETEILNDLARIPRVVLGRRP